MPHINDYGISLSSIESLIKSGHISKQKHPTLPITIYNYTAKTQFEQKWNTATLMCRGLILADNGLIVAQPMKKFFNLNDNTRPETLENSLLQRPKPIIFEQLDGSMGILWKWDKEFGIATRGSFTSPQAVWATEWLKNHFAQLKREGFSGAFSSEVTYIFEIIYKNNRIVCDYDYEGLVLIAGIYHGPHYDEYGYGDLKDVGRRLKVRTVRRIATTFRKCQTDDVPNKEGYVACFNNSSGFTSRYLRVKVKHPTYVRLHKLITGFNPKDVWEMLSTPGSQTFDSLLSDKVPASFKEWLMGWRDKLTKQYEDLEQQAKAAYGACPLVKDPHNKEARKHIAGYFLSYHKELSPIMFLMLDGSDYAQVIWDQIKPKGTDSYLNKEATAQ